MEPGQAGAAGRSRADVEIRSACAVLLGSPLSKGGWSDRCGIRRCDICISSNSLQMLSFVTYSCQSTAGYRCRQVTPDAESSRFDCLFAYFGDLVRQSDFSIHNTNMLHAADGFNYANKMPAPSRGG